MESGCSCSPFPKAPKSQRQNGGRGLASHARSGKNTETGQARRAGKILRRPGNHQRQLVVAGFKKIRLRGLRTAAACADRKMICNITVAQVELGRKED